MPSDVVSAAIGGLIERAHERNCTRVVEPTSQKTWSSLYECSKTTDFVHATNLTGKCYESRKGSGR
ncbi:unnamed protein product, partial [Heterotrigona itama]